MEIEKLRELLAVIDFADSFLATDINDKVVIVNNTIMPKLLNRDFAIMVEHIKMVAEREVSQLRIDAGFTELPSNKFHFSIEDVIDSPSSSRLCFNINGEEFSYYISTRKDLEDRVSEAIATFILRGVSL